MKKNIFFMHAIWEFAYYADFMFFVASKNVNTTYILR